MEKYEFSKGLVGNDLAGSCQISANDAGTVDQSGTPLTQRRSIDVPRTKWGYTYFVKRGNAIKIGHSAIPKQRISGLQVAFHEPLEILAVVPNTFVTEAAAHEKFAHLRMQGEWFRAEPDLIEFILAVKIAAEGLPKALPAKVDQTRIMIGQLSRLRKAYGADSPMGHACSNLAEMLPRMETYVRPAWATDERQTLPFMIKKQIARIAELKAAAH